MSQMRELTSIVMHHSYSTERSVLASMLISQEALEQAIEQLTEKHFYNSEHIYLFRIMHEATLNNIGVDIISIDDIISTPKYKDLIQASTVHTLAECKTSTDITDWIRILNEKRVLRELQRISQEIEADFNTDKTVEEIVSSAQLSILNVALKKETNAPSHISNSFDDIKIKLKNAVSGSISGLETGFKDLDDTTTGLHPGDYTVLAGRPSMGKTALAINIGVNIAKTGKNILFFSLEMPKEQLVMRMLCSEYDVSMHNIRKGKLSEADSQRLNNGLIALNRWPFIIDDSPALNALEISMRTKKVVRQNDIALIVIDYLQLMSPIKRTGNRVEEIAENSRHCKIIAKELNVPIIVLSQLSRAVEQRGGDKKPILSDLRDSGSIEQDADNVLFVYRPEYYNIEHDQHGRSTKNIAEIIIAKQRNGPVQIERLYFIKEYIKFANLHKSSEKEPWYSE